MRDTAKPISCKNEAQVRSLRLFFLSSFLKVGNWSRKKSAVSLTLLNCASSTLKRLPNCSISPCLLSRFSNFPNELNSVLRMPFFLVCAPFLDWSYKWWSEPKRSAASVISICSIPNSSKAEIIIARPPGRTGLRSAFNPNKFNRSICFVSSTVFLSRSKPWRVMTPPVSSTGRSWGSPLKPFSAISSAIALAVPEEPIACSQPIFL